MIDTSTDWATDSEARVLDAGLKRAPTSGWTLLTLNRAAKDAGLSAADAELLMPGGPRDLAALLSRRHDRAMLTALEGVDPRSLKMRDRIGRALLARLDAAAADEAAVRRCAGFLAFPTNLALATRLLWDSADAIWRWAGDAANDENHYSKRAILSAILGSALMVRLSGGRAAAEAYVHSRIGEVIAFEKWKGGLPKTDFAAQAAGVLGKIRYGAGSPKTSDMAASPPLSGAPR
jgi:ubiquinone biosynthesis protein COQ9